MLEQFVTIAPKLALIRVDIARAISQVRIQDDLLGRQRFGGAVEHKEKIEDALSRFIETGLRIPLFNCRGRVACRHRVLA